MNYEKIPLINRLYKKIKSLEASIAILDSELSGVAEENINMRLKLKKLNHEKIKVVFVCWRPAVWGSLKTVYEAMKKDNDFDVQIVTIPNKKQLPKLGFHHEIYESEGAEEFWKGEDVVSGYNYETGEWLDLRLLKADYICFQQPYNICRTGAEKSHIVSKYAKLFYVAYFTFFNCNESNFINYECTPPDFMKDLSFYFTQNNDDQVFMQNRMREIGNLRAQVVKTGFPRFDNLHVNYDINTTAWNIKSSHEYFRLIWTPRWCTDENNCHFFDYKDKLLQYCSTNEKIDFVFRPHPQAFLNWASTGELSEIEAKKYRERYEKSNNMCIDTSSDFLPTFYTADCLITDTSSVVPEFFLTGKPVIYCYKKGSKNSFARNKGYTNGFYWVESWSELKDILDMLRSGTDPLFDKRQQLIKRDFYLPNEGAGYLIKEAIKQDFNNA